MNFNFTVLNRVLDMNISNFIRFRFFSKLQNYPEVLICDDSYITDECLKKLKLATPDNLSEYYERVTLKKMG
jgi:hypothetical protein